MALPGDKELRSNRRVSTEMSVRFLIVGGEGELSGAQRAKTTNLSVQGIAFLSPLHIQIDSRLEVEIVLPGGAGELACEATVMRVVRELPGQQGFEYGLQFDMDTLKEPTLLDEFVRSIDIVPLLKQMIKEGASDLHLSADTPPVFRRNRQLVPAGRRALSSEVVSGLILGTLSAERREKLRREKELFYPFIVPGVGRWRGSVFYQRGNIEATYHAIDTYVPTIAELGLPDVIHNLALGSGGLLLVTGSSNSGKSTTLAAMIRAINHESERVIITLEDPIQYVHQNERSIIKQREVGTDILSMADGLRHIMRQDPDVLLIDDVPDSEVMDVAFRVAETGHLVLASFPTPDAVSTIKRIVGLYPREHRAPPLHYLSTILRGIISQRLIPSFDGTELVMIPEVLTMNDSIRSAIWTDKVEQIPNLMMNSPGSITIDSSLRNLILRGQIDFNRASQIARDPEGLRRSVAV